MGKFSDSPYFLLKDYFFGKGDIYNLALNRPAINYEWPVIWEDRDFVTFEGFNGIAWNLRYSYDPNVPNTDGSYLVGDRTNIITNGDGLIELWIKEIDEPYKQFLPITLRWKRLDDVNFIFDDSDLHNIQPGSLTDSLSGLRYWFDFFDGDDLNYDDIINNNREVYFRKDSIYHEWLTTIAPQYYPLERNHETDIRNFVNSDTIFSYFGKIYKYIQDEREFRIIFDGLMEYVMRAIPEHQQTTNFDKFTEIFFDREWHEIYNQIKNIWTLIDPMEVDEDFLGYLSKYYHMYDLISPTLFRQREFVRDLIWMLKRKGTYVEFYIIWRVLAETNNQLNIYEKWHDREIINRPETHVLPHEWEEYIYVEKPEYEYSASIGGAGVGWYNKYYENGEPKVDPLPPSGYYNYPVTLSGYNDDGRILSTHYKLEIDVSSEPLLPDSIINEDLWNELWQYWEYVRPVNRVVDYNILLAPITDFSGSFISLYDKSSNSLAYCQTKSLLSVRLPDGWFQYFPAPSGSGPLYEWVIDHDLNTKYLHTMAVDTDFNQIIPDEIEIIDKSRVVFRFQTPIAGWALLKKSQIFVTKGGSADLPWNIYHYRKKKEVILEFHNNDMKLYQESNKLIDQDYTIAHTGPTSPVTPASSGAYVFVQDQDNVSSWEIPHQLYYQGVILAVYDEDDNQIVQYDLNLTAIDRCTLDFDKPTKGYAVLIPVTNFGILGLIDELRNILRNGVDWRAGAEQGDLESGIFAASGSIYEYYEDDDFVYINLKVETDVEGVFKEWALYDSNGSMIVYTKCSPIYKPAGTTMVLHFRMEKTAGGLINT